MELYPVAFDAFCRPLKSSKKCSNRKFDLKHEKNRLLNDDRYVIDYPLTNQMLDSSNVEQYNSTIYKNIYRPNFSDDMN